MAEETLTEALSNLNDDNIKDAAVPEHKQAEYQVLHGTEDPQDESTFIELTDEDVGEVASINEDEVKVEFEEGLLGQDDEELSEIEREMKKAGNRVNQAVKQAKDWQRREIQALQYAKQLQEDNKRLSSQLQLREETTAKENLALSKNYTNEFQGRVDAQVDSAKVALTKAYDAGDSQLMADAQQQLARAEAERNSLEQYKRDLVQYEQDLTAYNQNQANATAEFPAQQPQGQPQGQPAPQYSEPSQKAQGWAEKNEWFGVDRIMTSTAMAIHQELAESGIDLESNEYYSQLDNRLREELPNRFQATNNEGNSGKPVQTVVSGTRTTGNGRSQNDRRVELTPSEQALAKKLGVPFKEYAKQKLRLQAS